MASEVLQWDAITMRNWKSRLGKGFCDHCFVTTTEGYLCDACDGDGFVLCFNCMDRYGREAHAHQRGSAHTFSLYRFRIGCNICIRAFQWHETPFLRCSKWLDPSCRFDICGDCMNEHSNITNHTTQAGPEHTFRQIDPRREAPPIRQPDPYVLAQGEEVMCSACKSRIHTEFFRCLNCRTIFDICARCADEGQVAKHVMHNFTYLVVSHKYGQGGFGSKPQTQIGGRAFSNRNNPESNR